VLDPTEQGAEARRPARSPLGVGEASLIATGLVALLAARRRARLRAAEPPARVPVPRPETAATERELRRLDDGERLLRIDIALRSLASTVAGTDHRVVAIRSAPDGTIEVTLTGDVAGCDPWFTSGHTWMLPATVAVDDLAPRARTVGAPCVALAQVGVDHHGWDVLVDLEATGVLAVDAEGTTADSVVRAMAVGLASSEFAEVAHLIGVGLEESDFLGHRHAQVADSLDAGIELAATLSGATATSQRSTFTLRSRHTSGEIWEPAIVLVASAHAGGMPTVAASLSRGVGVGLVVAGAVDDAPWTLRSAESGWTLEPLGLSLVPIGVEGEDLASLVDAIDGEPFDVDPTMVPFERSVSAITDDREHELFAERSGSHVAVLELPAGVSDAVLVPSVDCPPLAEPAWELMVRILGPVDVIAANRAAVKFDRSKTLELLAWMVTHRERSTRIAARTALWDQDVRDATFANVVSEARRALARHVEPPDGDEWVRRTLTDELSLHHLVVSDADLVRSRFDAGRRQSGQAALDTLRPAIELLRDLPFASSSYLWPETDGIASSLVMLSTNITAEYAKRALAVGDFEGVFWSTGHGLTVLPGQEALIALRMQAHAEAGDLSGVRVEWETYERIINADPWSDGEPAPKLVSLRRQLLSR
jgi:hypothetical protein